MEEVSSVDGASLKNYDSFGQLVGSTRAGSLDETYSYDASGNRQVAGTIIGKGNRIFYDGTFRYLYDAEGSLTEKTRVLMAQGSEGGKKVAGTDFSFNRGRGTSNFDRDDLPAMAINSSASTEVGSPGPPAGRQLLTPSFNSRLSSSHVAEHFDVQA